MNAAIIANSKEAKKITFPGQFENEQVVLIKRRHLFVIFGLICLIVALLLVPFFIYFIFPLILNLQVTEIFQKLFLFVTSLYLLAVCIISFFIIIDYYLDLYIITDQRIISIEQKGLFRRVINELRYDQIQDITSSVSGIIATFFQFGNIKIQTAAEEERMILKQITRPIETRRLISDAHRKALENTKI